MPSFAAQAASGSYLEALLEQKRQGLGVLPDDWRVALEFIEQLFADDLPGPAETELSRLSDLLRRHGHLLADLDPLGRTAADDPARTELLSRLGAIAGPAWPHPAEPLRRAYCGPVAVDLGHLDNPAAADWIAGHLESPPLLPPEHRRDALEDLLRATEFEAFMARRFTAKKRFGAEGSECLIPLLRQLIRKAASGGAQEVVIASMHRGRLSLMANVLGKPLEELFAEMKGAHPFPEAPELAGDVPYHLGVKGVLPVEGGEIAVTLLPNPSHLEAVNAVAAGYARARQDVAGDARKIVAIVLHTDASVVAQGVVGELIQLSGAPGFTVGGTIHVVVNNQIGFTTDPELARTSRYCTGPWKAVDSLIVHVNGGDPDAVVGVADLVVAYRSRFAADAVIDLVCYRGNGHNEIDEPRFTQPIYYRLADTLGRIDATYGARLVAEGVVDPGFASRFRADYHARLDEAYERALVTTPSPPAAAIEHNSRRRRRAPVTGLLALGAELSEAPDHLDIHPKLRKQIEHRRDELRNGVTWPLAEALAFASLLSQGVNIRLSGEDVARGAFSHRHLRLVDQTTGAGWTQLAELASSRGRFEVHDSPLSEYAVLGFEYGYSVAAPDHLVIWEAQFGDFANGAQIVLDQFIASGFEKWRQRSRLVLLLPHGLEGQGPEHSSARPERLLQLAAKQNLCIAHPSTPANYFHLLRRQALEADRPPLIVLSPKRLLRLKEARSALEAFSEPPGFQNLLCTHAPRRAARIIFCSGKIAYELEQARAEAAHDDAAIVRIEQLYPFPSAEIAAVLRRWPGAAVVWLQEEPRNLGAWSWLRGAFRDELDVSLRVVSRPESASPAGSFHTAHEADQQALVQRALFDGTIV